MPRARQPKHCQRYFFYPQDPPKNPPFPPHLHGTSATPARLVCHTCTVHPTTPAWYTLPHLHGTTCHTCMVRPPHLHHPSGHSSPQNEKAKKNSASIRPLSASSAFPSPEKLQIKIYHSTENRIFVPVKPKLILPQLTQISRKAARRSKEKNSASIRPLPRRPRSHTHNL